MTERLIAIEEEGLKRVIFVGPSMVKDFINSIIKEKHLEIIVADHYANLKSLKDIDPQTFNVLLLFDEDMARINRIIKELDISRNKLLFLW
ncbi:MAG: hypothetical protein JRJ65_10020 [Deltaproteobacteria bacterium]|nr:hypothetical protein [Deltaproteobacteria bacterium]